MHKQALLLLLLGSILLLLSGCTLLSRSPKAPKDSDKGNNHKTFNSTEYVPRSQYEELLSRYRDLQQQDVPPSTTVEIDTDRLSSNNVPMAPLVPLNTEEVATTVDVEEGITLLKQAAAFIDDRKFATAINTLKDLEKSSHPYIKVYAKFYIGEVLFQQKEYDLALQTFEEIIQKYAFSSVVLKSLERITLCCQKLDLKEKYEKYNMLLNNFFTIGT
ncbi:MAG: hypothetical protein HQK50_15935 [Oligoflexia bacterium]|nr:hypothetical protein [Oligoflexia bacterium]MBF0367065.1 hypothetical protein [Oligoflexia bacterium]